MEQDRRLKLESAMANWKAKGNVRLADACAVALEGIKNRPSGITVQLPAEGS